MSTSNQITLVDTAYGPGEPFGRTPQGELVVMVRRSQLTAKPPNDRGGPCILVIVKQQTQSSGDQE
ncbi:MAG: hypothetical protein JW726_20145 [Anaerolineales bacterium]|nr:hypothetical protein [Anaerolineales bacterium]